MATKKMIFRRKTANGWDVIDPYAENFREGVEEVLTAKGAALDEPGIKAAIMEAMNLGAQNAKELEKWGKQRIQQLTGTISNKFVVRGCIVSPVEGTRNIKVTEGEEYSDTGISLAYIDGHLRSIPDKWNTVAAVPQNKTDEDAVYYAYLEENDEGRYEVNLSEKREGILALYRLVVPAGDRTANLNRVRFYDERRVEEDYTDGLYSEQFRWTILADERLKGFYRLFGKEYLVREHCSAAAIGERFSVLHAQDLNEALEK